MIGPIMIKLVYSMKRRCILRCFLTFQMALKEYSMVETISSSEARRKIKPI